MKKFFRISTVVLTVGIAATLAGCSGCAGCAGCAGDGENVTVTNSNWYTATNYKGIQDSFIYDEAHPEYTKEIVEYDVTFDGASAANSSYSVEYKNGSYITEFYGTHYEWGTSLDKYKSDRTETVYCFKTKLNIQVKYTLKDGTASDWFDDSVYTESYFRAAGKNLQPVFSRQEIKSTSPKENKAKTLDKAYTSVYAVYENYYNYNCTEVTTVTKDDAGNKTGEKTEGFDKVKNTVFDNSSLYVAVRSMNLSANSSQTVSIYSPAAGGVSSYAITATDNPLGAEERADISSALAEKGLCASDGTGINASAMNVNYTGGALNGTTQTVWYAAVENPDNNTARATMLKISVPLSFNLGTLNYTLNKVVSTLWNE